MESRSEEHVVMQQRRRIWPIRISIESDRQETGRKKQANNQLMPADLTDERIGYISRGNAR